ncbi:hypothetical protein [Luteibacter sp. SG786]|uniref:hypothetical protein n=1 Tax=Luteibacter sp. SG786 TaxID=2587130 RepID=UPI0014227668|nr:hypothetical protein [Luteibacter sp. SG786]NII54402.1 hypothetical protein [Luteibacter sp. SG786]
MISPSRPGSNVIPCTLLHLLYLCERMREDERAQYMALSGASEFSPETAAVGFFNTPGLKFTVLGPDNYPAASGGAEQIGPGVWQTWMVGSPDGWTKTWRSLTKAASWLVNGLLEQDDVRRVQATCLCARSAAAKWFERSLGMQLEGIWRKYGRNGEDIAMFARVAEG